MVKPIEHQNCMPRKRSHAAAVAMVSVFLCVLLKQYLTELAR